jgi:hypothetical protein
VVRSHGVHEFLWPPASGDQIVLPSTTMGITIVRVAYTEHSPRWPGTKVIPDHTGPGATVFVRWLADED